MSHAATNWAILQRGLKPATKIVLWHLCDRYNPDLGCFPSQERLAEDCEMARSTINEHMIKLEDARLVRRIEQVDPTTRRQLPTRYILAFEPEFESQFRVRIPDTENQPQSEVECGGARVRNPDTDCGKAVSGKSPSRVRILPGSVSDCADTEPVREPVINQERAGARASEPLARAAPGEKGEPATGEAGTSDGRPAGAPLRLGVAAPAPATKRMTPSEFRRGAERRFLGDWLRGRAPLSATFRALDLPETDDFAAVEGQALALSRSSRREAQRFIQWAENCSAGDPETAPPIAAVARLIDDMAEPQSGARMARQIAIVKAWVFPPLGYGEDDGDDDDGDGEGGVLRDAPSGAPQDEGEDAGADDEAREHQQAEEVA